ncbi:hypothetical protein ACOI1H_19620 [Loktanella sp. DJP18]|uniref:hypothetical protein n=1 Tax=Loktanella sp. DJP18 TaxID=3409788 RepID=UPI003BB6D50B
MTADARAPHSRNAVTCEDRQDTSKPFAAILKAASQRAHLRAERGFQPFLHDPSGELPFFLGAQLCAHEALLAASPDAHPAAHRLVATLRVDCCIARIHVPPLGGQAARTLHPLAVDYLIFGGRRGNAVVRRLLERTPDAAIPLHFAENAAYDAVWARVIADLNAIPQDTALARRLIADVDAGFHLFDLAIAASADLISARTRL